MGGITIRQPQVVNMIFSRKDFHSFVTAVSDRARVLWLALSGDPLSAEESEELEELLTEFFSKRRACWTLRKHGLACHSLKQIRQPQVCITNIDWNYWRHEKGQKSRTMTFCGTQRRIRVERAKTEDYSERRKFRRSCCWLGESASKFSSTCVASEPSL